MASSWYANGIDNIMKGSGTFASTLRAVLLNSTGEANLQFDTHVTLNTIIAGWRADADFQVVNTGGAIVGASDHVNFGSGGQVLNFTTVGTGQKAKGIIIFESDATTTTSNLICFCSFVSTVNTDGTDVDVTLNASGFARASY